MTLEPFDHTSFDLAERGLLQRFGRNQLTTRPLQFITGTVQFCLQASLVVARSLMILQRLLQTLLRRAASFGCCHFAQRTRLQLFFKRHTTQQVAFTFHALLLLQQATQTVVELLDTRTLHHRFLVGIGGLAGEGFPALLPGSEQTLGFFEAALGGRFHFTGGYTLRLELGQRRRQFIGLHLVAGQNGFRLYLCGRGLVEVRALTGAQILGELQALFGTGVFGTQLVVPCLDSAQGFLTRSRSLARLLYSRLCGTQRGHGGLQREFTFTERMTTPLRFGIEIAQAQGQ